MPGSATRAKRQQGSTSDSPTRSYQDESHKPELVFALTRFEGMAGFRDVEKSAQILRALHLPWADDVAWRLESGPAFQTLHAVVAEMLAMSGPGLVDLLAEIGAASVRAEARGHRRRSARPDARGIASASPGRAPGSSRRPRRWSSATPRIRACW